MIYYFFLNIRQLVIFNRLCPGDDNKAIQPLLHDYQNYCKKKVHKKNYMFFFNQFLYLFSPICCK